MPPSPIRASRCRRAPLATAWLPFALLFVAPLTAQHAMGPALPIASSGRPAVAAAAAANAAVAATGGAASAARTRALAPDSAELSPEDSALVRQILTAEDRRRADDPALARGAAHPDARIRALAERARERIRDPRFARRDSLAAVPAPSAPPPSPEPAWKPRWRSLARATCDELAIALDDDALPVRLRAAARVDSACAGHRDLGARLAARAASLPAAATWRDTGRARWHDATAALLALAAVDSAAAAALLPSRLVHPQPEVRAYAVRTAARLGDVAAIRVALDSTLARLAAAPAVSLAGQRATAGDANVAETAIVALAALTGHADDLRFLRALALTQAAPVRVAAEALDRSPHPDAATFAARAFARWVARDDASARDVRYALLRAAGRDTTADQPPTTEVTLDPALVPLALGADIRLRVTRDPQHGGGSFDVRLRGDLAPITGARVLALVRERWYDGALWQRVEHDFVIQGGGPAANEYVGTTRFLRDELGTFAHPRGSIGMSTRGHDTGDGQWFVNLRDNARLTRDYTVFADVVAGMDVVDDMLEGDRIASIRIIAGDRP